VGEIARGAGGPQATMNPCKLCGLNLDLVGRTHRCIQRVANASPPANDVANAAAIAMANATSTYKYRDVDKRRAYMRDLMKKYRAKLKRQSDQQQQISER
jgi:hypothetical protein